MALTLTITADTPNELRAQVKKLLGDEEIADTLGKPVTAKAREPLTAQTASEAPDQPKKKRGRPAGSTKKTTKVPEAGSGNAPASPAAPAEAGTPTALSPASVHPQDNGAAGGISGADFRAKLQEACNTLQGGLSHVTGVLHEFGFQKVRDVPADKYGEIITKIDELMAGAAKA